MEIQGKVCAVLDEKRFSGSRGEVVKNFFVVETTDKYPQKLKFEVFGEDLWQKMRIAVGSTVSVSFDIKGSEWKGNYYVNLNAWMVKTLSSAATSDSAGQAPPSVQSAEEKVSENTTSYKDQLPF